MARKYSRGVTIVAIAGISLCCLAFAYPFLFVNKHTKQQRHDPSRPLPPNVSMRGAYINSGSKDIGPDPDAQIPITK